MNTNSKVFAILKKPLAMCFSLKLILFKYFISHYFHIVDI
jgi:hypothetical protein